MNKARILTVAALFFLIIFAGLGQEIPKLGITELPNLPAQEAGKTSLGFAGMVAAHIMMLLSRGAVPIFPTFCLGKVAKNFIAIPFIC
ncbi:hypothetical protein Q2T40_00200 [Winogradskyella maritima]|nr:hypothetical protein [Winogradskyella maritima]